MRRTSAIVIAVLVVLGIAFGPPSAQAAVSPDGYRDFQFGSSCTSAPTGEKPESKLWWNDGSWWGSLCATDNHYHIFRLDLATQKWLDTGTLLDDRPTSKADTLWDAANKKLYVASHLFTTSAASSSSQSNWGRLYRYSYNAGVYTLDSGFPVTVSKGKSEAMVLAKASNGILWVTYVESNKVMINHSSGSDTSWGTPYTLPVTGASNLSGDDISANIAFDTSTASPKIGVLWSNQNDKKMNFAWHADADQNDQNWSSFAVFTTAQTSAPADDHINIKLQSDGRGVYAVTKTSNSTSSAPLIVLVSCSANCASASGWSIAEVYKKGDNQTRAILLIDTTHSELNVFSATESGGSIYRKKSPITNPSFPPGLGDQFVFIRKTSTDAKINNPTSTKQNVNSTTGLVVLASDESARDYLHNYDSLTSGTPTAPTASFSAAPTTGTAPLAVSFSDLSTGGPTSWAWDFDNNGTVDSTAQNPSFTYANAGTYSVKLTVSNANGSNTLLKTNYITANTPSGGSPTADFSATPTTGTAPLPVSFSDLSTGGPTSWAWDFDNNGTVDSTAQNPSFTYANAGTYSVKLTVSNANGSNTKTKTGYITVNTSGGSAPIKAITFESGSLVNATNGVDSTSGSVSLLSGGQQLKGQYSVGIPNATSAYLQQSFTAADDIYVSFYMRVNSLPGSAVRIAMFSNAGTTVGNIQLMPDGRLQLRNVSTMIGAYSAPLSVNTIYRIGLHQKKGAGGDAVLEAYVAANGAAFGSPFAATGGGTWTTPADRLRFGSTAGGALDALFDDIKLDTAALP
jgi:PKD repeat protein